MVSRAILWDFDGTLARRPGLWGQVLVEILDDEEPDHGASLEDIRTFLRDGFPWHEPNHPHPELNDPRAWWGQVTSVLASTLVAVGIRATRAPGLAEQVRPRFLDPDGWEVFDDVRPVLDELRDDGWRHVIVSNHVPELGQLVDDIRLSSQVDAVVTSARVGFEKPHPGIFQHALKVADRPSPVWMVGDNPEADVAGAEAVGIPAILVRREGEAARRAEDLHEVAGIIAAENGSEMGWR